MDLPIFGTLSPEDLKAEEVDAVLDPDTTGVAELSPATALPCLVRRLETLAENAKGEKWLLRQAALALAVANMDPKRGYMLIREVIEKAQVDGSLLGEAEGLRAIGAIPYFFTGESSEEITAALTRGIELFAYLGMDLHRARLMVDISRSEYRSMQSPERSVKTLWQARAFALQSQNDSSLRHECLGDIAGLLGQMSWESERDVDLARRYAAISILHHRRTKSPFAVAGQHLQMGIMESQRGELATSRRHAQRAAIIHEHHHQWWEAFRAIYWLGMIQLDLADVNGARNAFARMLALVQRKSMRDDEMVGPAISIIEGILACRDSDWNRAIELLEPNLTADPVQKDTRFKLAGEIAYAFDKLGMQDRSIAMLRQALKLQAEMYESRLEGNSTGFVLEEEIRKLREAHGVLAESAKRDANLLRAILPPSAYNEFKTTGSCKARFYERVTLFFSDFAGFTEIAASMPPQQLLDALGAIFEEFDHIMVGYGCERVETIGDAYLAVAGLGGDGSDINKMNDAAEIRMVRSALDISRHLESRNAEFRALGTPEFVARIGIHCGSIVGGLVGSDRARFAVIGDAVNTAQRMEAGGTPGRVTVSEQIASVIAAAPEFEMVRRKRIVAKGKGLLSAWEVRRVDPRRLLQIK